MSYDCQLARGAVRCGYNRLWHLHWYCITCVTRLHLGTHVQPMVQSGVYSKRMEAAALVLHVKLEVPIRV